MKTEKKEKIPRIAVQKFMTADVEAILKKAQAHFALDPNDADAQRRFFRAVVTLASQRLFDLGIPPPIIATQAFEAIVHETEFRQKQAAFHGMPFGPLIPAKA
jgi:hypothetical protein